MTLTLRIALLLLLAVTGCALTDPYERPGVWRPNHANDTDLRAMLATPSDLIRARTPAPADGGLAAAAVARLRRDRVRPLPDSGLAQVVPVSGASAPQPVAPAVPGVSP